MMDEFMCMLFGYKLLHLVGEGLEVLLKNAAQRSLVDSILCGQFGRRIEGFVLNFSIVFLNIRLIRTVPWPDRLNVWPISLNFLTTFQTISRRI